MRPTESSIGTFMNLQFSSANECFHHYLADGGIGKAYKEQSAKAIPNKLLDFIGVAMQSTTECLMMQRKDEVNSQVNFSDAKDIMAQFKKRLSSYQLIDPQSEIDLPPINDLDQILIDMTVYKNHQQ